MKAETLDAVASALESWRHDGDRLTQEAIARVAGVTITTAHLWCQGKSLPRLDQLLLLERERPGLIDRILDQLRILIPDEDRQAS